jgi:hypothetical protein
MNFSFENLHIMVEIVVTFLGPVFIWVIRSIVASGIDKVNERIDAFKLEFMKELGEIRGDRQASQIRHDSHERRLAVLEQLLIRIGGAHNAHGD